MRKTLGISLAAGLLALTSACGGSGDGDAAPAAADGSSPSAAAKQPAAAPAEGELTQDNFVERLSAAQLEAGSAHMEMTSGMGGQTITMSGDVQMAESVADSASHLTMDMGAMTMDLRLVEGVMYLKMGEMTGGKYAKIDLTDPDSPLAQQYGSMADQADPTAQLQTFKSALVEFDNQGDGGEIDGVDTTKIEVAVDTAKVLEEQGQQLPKSMPKELRYVMHVGADDLLRKMTMDLAGTESTLTWTKWGEPVEVEAPAKDEISDMKGLGGFPTAAAPTREG